MGETRPPLSEFSGSAPANHEATARTTIENHSNNLTNNKESKEWKLWVTNGEVTG